MKILIIALLVLCATNASHSSTIDISEFRNSINEFVEQGNELYKNAVDKILEHSNKLDAQLNDTANNVAEEIEKIFKMADEQFQQYKKIDGPEKKCIEKYETDYQKVKADDDGDEKNFKKCFTQMNESVKNFKDNINNDIETIKKRNEELGEKVKQCSNLDSVSVAGCFGEKWFEFFTALTDIQTTSDNVFDKNLKVELQLIFDTKKCGVAALEKTAERILAVIEKMNQCVKELKSN